MKSHFVRRTLFQLIVVSLVSMSCMQYSAAAVISTGEYMNVEIRGERIERVQAFMARQDVARQLARFGVSADDLQARVMNLTDAELVELEGAIGSDIAGGDALGTIGLLFLILIILELVGVTDIFKSI